MRLTITLTVGLALGTGWSLADPGPKDAAKVDSKLVGRWTLVRSFNAKAETTEEPPRTEYEFTADGKWIMRRDGKDYVGGPGTFTTDTTTSPAQLDTVRDPDHPTQRLATQKIYKIEGDTLTIHTQGQGGGRPTSFDEIRFGSMLIFKRAKKEAAAPAPKEVPKPDPKLVGRWGVVRTFSDGTETTEKDANLEYEFTADSRWVFRRGGKASVSGPGKFTTDPKKDPAQIDLVYVLDIEGPTRLTDRLECLGTYKIEGDTLTIRTADPGADRPASVDAPGKGYKVIFKRVKKKD